MPFTSPYLIPSKGLHHWPCVGRSLPLGPTRCPVVIKQAVYESRLYGLKRLLGASLAMNLEHCCYGYPRQCFQVSPRCSMLGRPNESFTNVVVCLVGDHSLDIGSRWNLLCYTKKKSAYK